MPVAQTFSLPSRLGGRVLDEIARLDTLVTVVDAKNFLDDFGSLGEVGDLGLNGEVDDTRDIAELLAEQVEFANVIVVNKADLVDDADVEGLKALVKELNPGAKVVAAEHGKVALETILNTGLFDLDEASQSPGWIRALSEGREHDHEDGKHEHQFERYGIATFVYRERRPFHPQRLADLLRGDGLEHVLRSKGFIWLATRSDVAGLWSQAGGVVNISPAGTWWAVAGETEWPDDPEDRAQIERQWHGEYGDRRQEIVLIGAGMEREALTAKLDGCLVTEEEMEIGPEGWKGLEDPFPDWPEPEGR